MARTDAAHYWTWLTDPMARCYGGPSSVVSTAALRFQHTHPETAAVYAAYVDGIHAAWDAGAGDRADAYRTATLDTVGPWSFEAVTDAASMARARTRAQYVRYPHQTCRFFGDGGVGCMKGERCPFAHTWDPVRCCAPPSCTVVGQQRRDGGDGGDSGGTRPTPSQR